MTQPVHNSSRASKTVGLLCSCQSLPEERSATWNTPRPLCLSLPLRFPYFLFVYQLSSVRSLWISLFLSISDSSHFQKPLEPQPVIIGDSKTYPSGAQNLSVVENIQLDSIHWHNLELASGIILLTWPIILLNPTVSNVLCN